MNTQQTGQVQLVLMPEAMVEALRRYAIEGNAVSQIRKSDINSIQLEGLNRIFLLLRENRKIDFAHYKPGTIGRRVQRRIDIMNLNSLNEYLEKLFNDPEEVNELYKDFLIGVTRFFRDAEAFELVENQILSDLVERRACDGIRIWVCGCAAGEEAYSLAFLFAEAIERSGKNIEFKMFATDVHQDSSNRPEMSLHSGVSFAAGFQNVAGFARIRECVAAPLRSGRAFNMRGHLATKLIEILPCDTALKFLYLPIPNKSVGQQLR